MTKQAFLAELEAGLSALPKSEVEERLSFYREMIDDRMEEGLSEEEAVRAVGSVKEIIGQSLTDKSLLHQIKDRILPDRRLTGLEIALIILGAPLWLSLLAGVLVICTSGYVVAWSVVVTAWALFVSLIASSVGTLFCAVVYIIRDSAVSAVAIAGVSLICAGAAIPTFYCSQLTTKGVIWVTVKITKGIKFLFRRKEDAK